MSMMKQLAEQVNEISDSIEIILGSTDAPDVIIENVSLQVAKLKSIIDPLIDIKKEPSIDGSKDIYINIYNNTQDGLIDSELVVMKGRTPEGKSAFYRPNPNAYKAPLAAVIVEAEGKTDKAEDSELVKSINAFLKATYANYTLSAPQKRKLDEQQRDAKLNIIPSANELWAIEPLFRQYVAEQFEYLKTHANAINGGLVVGIIVGYNKPKFGWIDWKAAHGTGILDWTD